MPHDLRPYGRTAEEYLQDAARNPVPEGWQRGVAARADRLAHWLRGTEQKLATVAWPRFDPARGDWKTEDAAYASMQALTADDFEVMGRIQAAGFLDRPASPQARGRTHREFFMVEDTGTFGGFHADYDASLPVMAQRVLPALIHRGLSECAGSLVIQLKEVFQRPRAFQTALWQNRTGLWRLGTRSADHPSFVSGHAMQGLVGTMHAWLSLRRLGYELDRVSEAALAQLAAHIGDRRVMAGVHYPSDSVASWIVALDLVEHVVPAEDTPHARRFLAAAIAGSPVHQALVGFAPGSAHAAMWRELGALMGPAAAPG